MKTCIELDCLLVGSFGGPTAHFGCQKRLYDPFGRPTLIGIQPNTSNLVRQKCS